MDNVQKHDNHMTLVDLSDTLTLAASNLFSAVL
jgi:hypothetical protein